MSGLEPRIAKLEALEAIRRGLNQGSLLYDGPYDADGLIEGWTADGHLDCCDGVFDGKTEIYNFYQDMAASFTTHYAMNGVIDLDPSCEHGRAHWYGWETPVVSGDSLIGAFSSDQEYVKVDGQWLMKSLVEAVHFLCAASAGWVKEAVPRKERKSQGAWTQ